MNPLLPGMVPVNKEFITLSSVFLGANKSLKKSLKLYNLLPQLNESVYHNLFNNVSSSGIWHLVFWCWNTFHWNFWNWEETAAFIETYILA